MQRFTISLDSALATAFDDWLDERGYENRSEAVRDLIRHELERSHQASAAEGLCVATLSYTYNHHGRELAQRLAALQHEHHDLAVSTMHVHLDHDHCLETVVLRGPASRVRRLADRVLAERGVHHGQLNLISVDVHGRHHHDDGGRHDAHSHLKPVV